MSKRPCCPKCAGFMVLSAPDLKCMNCGHMIYREVEPVMAKPGKTAAEMRGPGQVINPLVIKYYESIKRMRVAGESWRCICALIFLAEKQRLHERTAQKHYIHLQMAEQG